MSILESKQLNDWPLFYWIIGINSAAVIGYMPTQDLSVPLGVSAMIQCSVRLCAPLLFITFAASSLTVFAPDHFRRWLIRNRRYLGLGFAAGMGWQMVFIQWLLFGHYEYFAAEVFGSWKDMFIYRIGPYSFLTAMTITSFYSVRRRMNRVAWNVLHWVGIYYLYYVFELTYWLEVTYYNDRQIIDYVYVTMGGLAFLARVGEFARLRIKKTSST